MHSSNHQHQPFLRRTVALLLVLLPAATAWSQNINFHSRSVSAGEMISAIEAQSTYAITYDAGRLDTAHVVSVEPGTLPLKDALDRMTAAKGYSYSIRNRYIIINTDVEQTVYSIDRNGNAVATGDVYRRSSMEDLNAVPLRRSRPAPSITLADTTEVVADTVPDAEIPPFSSNVIAANSYLAYRLPVVALKTNLLYAAAAFTPNLAVEVGVGRRSTLQLSGSWNQWHYRGTEENNRKLNHYIVRPEYRYWFCERFTGHFLAADMFFSQYNISEYNLPLIGFEKEYRYEGRAWGGGVSYGYHLPFAKRWSAEFLIGVGVAQFKYKKSDCTLCSSSDDTYTKTYFGPTRAGISLVFMIK